MTIELNPCPHCGSTSFNGPFQTDDCWWVYCNNCEAGMETIGNSKEYLINAWNRRTPEKLENKMEADENTRNLITAFKQTLRVEALIDFIECNAEDSDYIYKKPEELLRTIQPLKYSAEKQLYIALSTYLGLEIEGYNNSDEKEKQI